MLGLFFLTPATWPRDGRGAYRQGFWRLGDRCLELLQRKGSDRASNLLKGLGIGFCFKCVKWAAFDIGRQVGMLDLDILHSRRRARRLLVAERNYGGYEALRTIRDLTPIRA